MCCIYLFYIIFVLYFCHTINPFSTKLFLSRSLVSRPLRLYGPRGRFGQ